MCLSFLIPFSGYTNRHDFTIESDQAYLKELMQNKQKDLEDLDSGMKIPGMNITTPSKPANQSQYPNLN